MHTTDMDQSNTRVRNTTHDCRLLKFDLSVFPYKCLGHPKRPPRFPSPFASPPFRSKHVPGFPHSVTRIKAIRPRPWIGAHSVVRESRQTPVKGSAERMHHDRRESSRHTWPAAAVLASCIVVKIVKKCWLTNRNVHVGGDGRLPRGDTSPCKSHPSGFAPGNGRASAAGSPAASAWAAGQGGVPSLASAWAPRGRRAEGSSRALPTGTRTTGVDP